MTSPWFCVHESPILFAESSGMLDWFSLDLFKPGQAQVLKSRTCYLTLQRSMLHSNHRTFLALVVEAVHHDQRAEQVSTRRGCKMHSAVSIPYIWLRLVFPLLVLKGIYHYWIIIIFFRGTYPQMEEPSRTRKLHARFCRRPIRTPTSG